MGPMLYYSTRPLSWLDDFSELSGYPAHAGTNDNRVPAVLRGCYQWKGAARRNGRKALVVRSVAAADVHLTAFGDDHHCRTNRSGFVRHGLFWCVRLSVIIRNSVHQCSVRFFAVLAVRFQTGLLLERQQRLFRFSAEFSIRAILGQRIAQLHQQLLQGFYVGTYHAAFQQAASQRNFRCGNLGSNFSVLNERQLVPVLPLAFLDLCANTTVIEAAPFHSIAVANVLKEGELKAKEIQGAIHKASRSSGGHYR